MSTITHSSRGASGSARWSIDACPASIRMSENVPNSTNAAAELGTAVHELGEFCLQLGLDAYECVGMTFNGIVMDNGNADAAQLYIGYVRGIGNTYGVKPMLEQRVTMFSVGDNVFGTADCIFIIGEWLYVIDYKNGYGIVEVKNNSQAKFYAVAVLDTFKLWGVIKHVKTAIVQPRADHIDGSIREYNYTIDEMQIAQQNFARSVAATYDENVLPNAGKHCMYCPASGSCRVRIMRTLNFATGDKPIHKMSKNELEIIYGEIGVLKNNLGAISSKVLSLARDGENFEGYKLVKAIVRAKCEDEAGFINESGVPKEVLYNPGKLISMTAAKKVVDKKVVDKYYVKPDASTTLVEITDNRPAISTNKSTIGVFSPVQ